MGVLRRLKCGTYVQHAQIRLTDVQAIEDCLDTIQHGSIEGEKGLSLRNCFQLWRLLQLSIEYLSHLKSAHMLLLQRYEEANIAAENWKKAAHSYMGMGQVFLTECATRSAMSRQRLEQLDQTRGALEETDRQYNKALDDLEVEDQRARYFHFRRQRTELSWKLLNSVDLEDLTLSIDTFTLDKILPQVCYGSILAEDKEEMTPHHFTHLIPLSQCCLDFTMFQANATGALLEQAMAKLQVTCRDIPTLTSSTQALHERISAVVLEAHVATQGSVRMSGGRPMSPMSPSRGVTSSYDEMQMMQLSGPKPSELRHTAEMHFRVEGLEQDLRMERLKTEEMRRALREIKERLGIAAGQQPSLHGSYEQLPMPIHKHHGSLESLSGAMPLPNPFENPHAASAVSPRGGKSGLDEDLIRKEEQRRAMEILASEAERFKQQALKLRSGGGPKHRRSDSLGIALPSGGGKGPSIGGGPGSGGLQRNTGAPGLNLNRQSTGLPRPKQLGAGGSKPPSRRSTATDGIGIGPELTASDLGSLPLSFSEGVAPLSSFSSVPMKGGGGDSGGRGLTGVPPQAVGQRQAPGAPPLEGSASLPPWFEAIKEKHGARPGSEAQVNSGSSEPSRDVSLEPSRENSFQPGGYPQSLGAALNRGGNQMAGVQPIRPSRLGR